MQTQGHKRALLVGINEYQNPQNNLRGCVNDVYMVGEGLVKHLGFERRDVTLLTDAQATFQNIESGLRRLVDTAQKNDVLVFHYSGHGSQIVSVNGDEEDGLDELICPYDMNWSHPFTDDHIADILSSAPAGVNLTMLMDCCHSGTINKAFTAPGFESPNRVRYLAPPTALIPNGSERKRLAPRSLARSVETTGVFLTRPILVAGCGDTQTSADAWIDGAYHGAFTFYVNECLRAAHWKTTYRNLTDAVRTSLGMHHFDQVPVLTAPAVLQEKGFLQPIV